jgi:oligoendopeptidase F
MQTGDAMQKDNSGALWDLTAFFPRLDGPEFTEYKKTLRVDVLNLLEEATLIGKLSRKSMPSWEKIILRWEELFARAGHLSTYIETLTATNAASEAYAREQADFNVLSAEFEKFVTTLGHALNRATETVSRIFFDRRRLRDISFRLHRLRQQAQFMMSPEKETLAADLNITGLSAWESLYNTLSGKLTFTLTFPDGRTEAHPASRLRGFLADTDRRVGKAAFDGGTQAWASIEDPCAAALNAISGTRLTLQRHRKVDHFLDSALFQAGIEKDTLDAMYEAVHHHLDLAKQIYRTRAAFSKEKRIWFFERETPLPLQAPGKLSWEAAVNLLRSAFDASYPELSAYYLSMVQNRWIDSLPRPGKRPGAFCAGSKRIGEQRIFMNYTGALRDVITLAHEVGHAWHGHMLKMHRPLAQSYPMTLAETASGFAEQLVIHSLLGNPAIDRVQKLQLLDADLSGAAVLLLDITTRFEFEKHLYAARRDGEVPVSRLKEMMAEAQHRIYGDVLDPEGADPLFWASKLHFYLTGAEFYNFPYTFGFLLARTLHRRFRNQGPSFLPRYEEFLKISGSDTVENIARRTLGVDITRPDFWTGAILGLAPEIDTYGEMGRAYFEGREGLLKPAPFPVPG